MNILVGIPPIIYAGLTNNSVKNGELTIKFVYGSEPFSAKYFVITKYALKPSGLYVKDLLEDAIIVDIKIAIVNKNNVLKIVNSSLNLKFKLVFTNWKNRFAFLMFTKNGVYKTKNDEY